MASLNNTSKTCGTARCLAMVLAAGMCFLSTAPCPAGNPTAPAVVEITNSKDGSTQPAWFWAPPPSSNGKPAPLLVGLHNWHGNYRHKNGLLEAAQRRGWVVILPNFRGPNTNPKACASELAIEDVLDAVAYAKKHANVDPRRIYLAGGSGGGHMALVMATKAPKLWAGVSAWVPITDLAAWHAECTLRKNIYRKRLEQVCGGRPGTPKTDEQYRARSPIFFLADAQGVAIDMNAGIHDGHGVASVPISHSLRAFNVLAEVNGCRDKMLTEDQIKAMTDAAAVPTELAAEKVDEPGRPQPVLFRREAGPVRVTLFDGGHEMDANVACDWLAQQKQKN